MSDLFQLSLDLLAWQVAHNRAIILNELGRWRWCPVATGVPCGREKQKILNTANPPDTRAKYAGCDASVLLIRAKKCGTETREVRQASVAQDEGGPGETKKGHVRQMK